MGWRKGTCKDKDVWIEVDATGNPVAEGGRVAVRYSDKEGAKIYRAGVGNLRLGDSATEDLPDGISADAAPAKAPSKRGSGFGSAGTRTAAQAAAAQDAAHVLIAGFSSEAAVCFTDGACKGNPGPAGSGAVVRLPDGRRLESWRALGKATNNVGELTAIGLALEVLDEAGYPRDGKVEILTDSSYSHGVLVKGWKAKANQELIAKVKSAIARRKARLHWIAGHVGIADNERADELANLGVAESIR